MQRGRHFKLDNTHIAGAVRALAGSVVTESQVEAGKQTWVTVTRTGTFSDPRYGEFTITPAMLAEMVRNFDARAYGQDIFLDVSHRPADGAAAKFIKLSMEGNRLRALAEWTLYGIDAVKNKGHAYLSAEFHEKFIDNETSKHWGCVLLGAALTTRPVIKRLDPVQLSNDSASPPVYVATDLLKTLATENTMKFGALLKHLKAQLEAKLSEKAVNAILKGAEKALETVTDEAVAKALCEGLAETELQEGGGNYTFQLASPGVAQDVVDAAVQKALSEQAAATKQLAETQASRVKLLSDTINAAASLDEATRKTLSEETAGLITADMSEDQVKSMAAFVISQAGKTAVARQLASLGWAPAGSPHITMPDEGAKKLSGIYHDNLKKTSLAAQGVLRLADKEHPFTTAVLAQFDRLNAPAIHQEAIMLAGGQTGMANTSLPVGFVREVIREALSDLNILQLVNTLTDFTATATTQIPETRDVSGVVNDGIVYEGQPINYASVTQAMDTAFITPMKVAYMITNEVIHFTRSSALNWDAMARNIETCARVMRELICRRLANELQRSADAYNAVAVTGESISSQLDGATKSTVKTAHFPIVRPYQAFNLQGQAQSSPENPLAVVLNGVPILPFDGSGTQTPGTYYRVTNYNLGYIQFVNQLGAPVFPAASGTNTLGYSRATNVLKVDIDIPGGSTIEKQMNKVLQAVGAQKAVLSGQRFVQPDFMLMSPTLNDAITNAEAFVTSMKRNGSDTSVDGDLERIKGISAFGTNAPGIDLGDQRIIMGQRGQLTYTVAKPFALGEPFEVTNGQGVPIGKKQAYGEEYNAIKMPTPIRNRMTSVLAYSVTGR